MKNYLLPADILLPDFTIVDGEKWSVVACDQYTSQMEYWKRVENFTKGKVYRVEDGIFSDDKGNKITWYGSPFKHIDGINSYCISFFKEIKH